MLVGLVGDGERIVVECEREQVVVLKLEGVLEGERDGDERAELVTTGGGEVVRFSETVVVCVVVHPLQCWDRLVAHG